MRKNKNSATLGRVLQYIKPQLPMVVISLVLSFVSVGLMLYVPIIVGDAVDLAVGAGNVNFEKIINLLINMAVVICVVGIVQWLIGVLNNRMTYAIVKGLRGEAFAKVQTLSVSYLDSRGHGKTLSRIISDVDTFSDGLLLGFTQLFTGLLTIVATLVFMLMIDWKITIIVVVLTPGSFLISKFIAGKTFSLFREQAQAKEEETSIVEEVLSSEKTVKAFGAEEKMIEKFEVANENLRKSSLGAIFYSSLVNPSTRFLNSGIYAVVALVGALFSVKYGVITVGALTCFLGYVNQYTKPFNEISGVITEFQNALACADRIFELLDEPSEVDVEEGNASESASGEVVFSDVSFSYDSEKPFIENLNFTAPAGKMVAIVGPTGCGKTTLINLLMRFYDVDAGRITIDGVDIRDISRHELRSNYGMVLQDTWLRRGTVAENIAIGKPDATRDEIIAAAKAVRAHSFIKRLPKGYDTVIGDTSIVLSAGQKQLISIARVMLAMPPVLILDEATSSIDTRTEARIQSAFDKLTKGRTSFVVAHRLATIKNADIILVMKDGKIVETGNHDTLITKDGLYSEIYHSQFISQEN